MKILCDVCSKEEAFVYCPADEAALCAACDHRVHHANKLAGKHPRFSLISPTPKDSPLCDICKEKRAFLFCQQDRAILCKDCDIPIHSVNEHTKKHNRFLLTGVKLSATSAIYAPSSTSSASLSNGCDLVPDQLAVDSQKTSTNSVNKPVSVGPAAATPNPPTSLPKNVGNTKGGRCNNQFVDGSGYGSNTSSISEYLIEMLPGWHVEDFLDAPSPFCKDAYDTDVMPAFWDGDLLDQAGNNMSSYFSSENMGVWVPRAPPAASSTNMIGSGGGQMGINSSTHGSNCKASRTKWMIAPDDGFTVPQISPPSTTSKRSRTLW